MEHIFAPQRHKNYLAYKRVKKNDTDNVINKKNILISNNNFISSMIKI